MLPNDDKPEHRNGLRRDAKQDDMPVEKRQRVKDWHARIAWMQETRPTRCADWPASTWVK